MEHTKHLYRFVITAIALGVCAALPSQALAAEGVQSVNDNALHASQLSFAALGFATPRLPASTILGDEAIAPASMNPVYGHEVPGHEVSGYSTLNRQRLESVLVASDYTPPDNGGPGDSRGSGTR